MNRPVKQPLPPLLLDRTEPIPRSASDSRENTRVQRATQQAVRRWRTYQKGAPHITVPQALQPLEPGQSVVRRIPPAQGLIKNVKRSGSAQETAYTRENFRAGVLASTWRLIFWVWLAFRLLAGNAKDWLLRKSTIERRAERMRYTLQRGGPTFIKIGQQLSLRIDILPYEYAKELEKMLDRVRPFPAEEAIAFVEEAIGGPLSKEYAAFDPKPIGAASVSCVYQAILHNGDRVAVKVRRPGVGHVLAADMRALGWLMFVLEFFILPPGFTDNFVDELRDMLLAELDFRMEARVQELFRRRVRKAGLRYITAPKVYFHLSNHCVIVEEYVTGAWLGDLLAAVEGNDEEALAVLRENNIRPRRVARRLLEVTRWSGFEGLLFHADLHPANIVVHPNSKLTFIDFGCSGTFTHKERLNWRRLMRAQLEEDVGGMAQAAIGLLEPLPPLDQEELTKKVEQIFWDHFYAYKSKHAGWWERTSAQLWISFLSLSREMQIPMNLNTIKMIRASMLVDTLALRLDGKVDQYKEYAKYEKGAGRRARKRLAKRSRRLFQNTIFLDVEELIYTVRAVIQQVRRTADSATAATTSLMSKASFVFSCVIQSTLVFTVTLVAGVVSLGTMYTFTGRSWTLISLILKILLYTPYQIFIATVLLVYGRRIALRLLDTDDD